MALLPATISLHRFTVFQQRDDVEGIGIESVVAEEIGGLQLRDEFGRQRNAAAEFTGCARAVALLVHQSVRIGKFGRRYIVQAFFAHDVENQIRRATVGVVQLEQLRAVEMTVALRQVAFEPHHARIQCLRERCFFRFQRAFDEGPFFDQLRIRATHDIDQGLQHAPKIAFDVQRSELPQMANRATHDPTQYIAAAFVARQHTIDDQEAAGPRVIGDHAQRFVFEIAGIGDRSGGFDQMLEQSIS